jgi:hypothetical protein
MTLRTAPDSGISPVFSGTTGTGHTVPLDISTKIDEIINKPGVLDYLAETVERTVVGNRLAIRLIILVCAQRGLANGYGVYLDVNGGSGDGKSYTVRQTLWILPPEIVADSSMSPKAIYHDNTTEPMVYYVDDINTLDEDLKSTLKSVLTNFRRPTVRKVTEKRGNVNVTVPKTVPARTVIIFSSVDSIGDRQLMNRLIPLPVEADSSMKKLQHDYQNDVASGLKQDLDTMEDERILICREIFRALTSQQVEIIVPFAHGIDWPEIEFQNSRNYNVFLDLIKLCALLEQRNREPDQQGRLKATYDDFYTAARIYAPRREMQVTKLSNGPQEVLNYLIVHRGHNFTQAELVERMKVNQGNLSRWLKILLDMSLVVEDADTRQGKDRSVNVKVYEYRGDPIVSTVFDSPLQLSESERTKPEYREWMAMKADKAI